MALSSYSYLPSWQPQLPRQPQEHIGMAEDDELLNLVAAATCGYSYSYNTNDYSALCNPYNFNDTMVVDPDPSLNDCAVGDYYAYHQSNCLSNPEHGFPFNPNDQLQLQLPFQQDFDFLDPCGNYNYNYSDEPLQTCHSRNEHKAAAAAEALMRKSLVNDSRVVERKRVTAQSLAARERRRKITEKTRELGKLVPGGNKMNTAEMLQSAFKYVQFLQSQLHLLQIMSSFHSSLQGNQAKPPPPLHVVASPVIQEKLYKDGNCIIPRDFAELLLQNSLDPLISEELHRLVN